MMEENKRIIDVNMDQWHEMALNGVDMPIRFCVCGDSMVPLIRRDRDVVTVVPLRRMPEVGDIVLFHRPGKGINYVLHRVWEVRGDMVRTFGDGCLYPDRWMPVTEVWGIAVRIRRGRLEIDPAGRPARIWSKWWNAMVKYRKWLLLPRRARRFAGRAARRILKGRR